MAIFTVIPVGDVDLTEPDPVTGKRSVFLLTGALYVRQKITVKLKFFLGEWYRDKREGVPYYRDVFVKNPNLDLIRSIFKAVIKTIPEVKSVDNLNLVYDPIDRILAVSFSAPLVGGDILVVQPTAPFIIRVQRTTD